MNRSVTVLKKSSFKACKLVRQSIKVNDMGLKYFKHRRTSSFQKLNLRSTKFSFSCSQVNTEPAKSKSFSLVVNEQEVLDGVRGEAVGRKSEDVAASGEIITPHGFGDFGESEVVERSGLETNTLKPVMESSEVEMPVVVATNKEEAKEEVEEEVEEEEMEKEKQSRSIVSVRLGEEGSRFSFAKVQMPFHQVMMIVDSVNTNIVVIFTVTSITRWKWVNSQVTARLWR